MNQGSGVFGKGDKVVNKYVTSSIQVVTNEDHTVYAVWEPE